MSAPDADESDSVPVLEESSGGNTGTYLERNARTVLGGILAAATLVSVVPIFVQVFNIFTLSLLEQVLVSVSLLLSAATGMAALTIHDMRSDIQAVRDSAQREIQRVKSMFNEKFYGLAFSVFLRDGPHSTDDAHYLTYAKTEHDFTDPDDVVFRERYEGYNATLNRTQEFLPIHIEGDSKMSPEEMGFEAEQRLPNGEWADIEVENEQLGQFEVLFQLYFEEPLEPNDRFEIRCRYSIGEVPVQNEQYAYGPQHRYLRGTEEMELQFLFNDIESTEARRVVNTASSKYFRSVERIDLEMEDQDVDTTVRDGKQVVTLTDSNADACYVFKFDF